MQRTSSSKLMRPPRFGSGQRARAALDGCRVEPSGRREPCFEAADAAAGGADPPPSRALLRRSRPSPLLEGERACELPADVAAAVADTLVDLFS